MIDYLFLSRLLKFIYSKINTKTPAELLNCEQSNIFYLFLYIFHFLLYFLPLILLSCFPVFFFNFTYLCFLC